MQKLILINKKSCNNGIWTPNLIGCSMQSKPDELANTSCHIKIMFIICTILNIQIQTFCQFIWVFSWRPMNWSGARPLNVVVFLSSWLLELVDLPEPVALHDCILLEVIWYSNYWNMCGCVVLFIPIPIILFCK
jgi:hypothetical protein